MGRGTHVSSRFYTNNFSVDDSIASIKKERQNMNSIGMLCMNMMIGMVKGLDILILDVMYNHFSTSKY